MEEKRVYGLKMDKVDLRDKVFSSTDFKTEEDLPKMIDLRSLCSPIVNQGSLGSCTANAIGSGIREFLLLKNNQPLVRLSRLFLYYHERAMLGTINEDSGASIRDGMKVLNTIGICSEDDLPYDIFLFAKPPEEHDMTNAQQYKVSEYHRITSLPMLKSALAHGYLVVFGMQIFESFESPQVAMTGIVPMPKSNEHCLGGHAILLVGYDMEFKIYIARNSWGFQWGQNGYFSLPFDYVHNADLASDFWVITQTS